MEVNKIITDKDRELLTITGIETIETLDLSKDRIELHIYDGINNYIESYYNLAPSKNNILQWEIIEDIPETTVPTGSGAA